MSALTPEVRAELGDLLARFAWALDLHAFDGLREVFTPDVHYGSLTGDFHDVEELIARFKARPGSRTTRHCLGNVLFSEQPDGTIIGRSSWSTWASNAEEPDGDPVEMYMVADFSDRFVPTDAGWRIAERIITPVLRDARLAPGAPPPHPTAPGATISPTAGEEQR